MHFRAKKRVCHLAIVHFNAKKGICHLAMVHFNAKKHIKRSLCIVKGDKKICYDIIDCLFVTNQIKREESTKTILRSFRASSQHLTITLGDAQCYCLLGLCPIHLFLKDEQYHYNRSVFENGLALKERKAIAWGIAPRRVVIC